MVSRPHCPDSVSCTSPPGLHHDSAPDVPILRDGDPVTGDTNGLSSLVEVEVKPTAWHAWSSRAKSCPYDMQRPRGLVTSLIQEKKNLRGNLSPLRVHPHHVACPAQLAGTRDQQLHAGDAKAEGG